MFIESFKSMQKRVTDISNSHGWVVTRENLLEKILLMHTELSEAVESLRLGDPPSDHIPSFSGVEEEFADVIIRIMSVAEQLELRVAEAIEAKTDFNKTRSYKHGGKLF